MKPLACIERKSKSGFAENNARALVGAGARAWK